MACKVTVGDIVEEVDIRTVLPEVTDTMVLVQSPQLKRCRKSYWHVGTSLVSRVKIDALRPGIRIDTKNATTIPGTSAEFWKPVQTLGTVWINILRDTPMQAHVIPSTAAPFTTDGIIGCDFIRKAGNDIWYFKDGSGQRFIIPRVRHIPNHGYGSVAIMHQHLCKNAIPVVTGAWALISRRIDALRLHLPSEIDQNDKLPIFSILDDFSDCFYLPGEKLGATTILSYPIDLGEIRTVPVARQFEYNDEYWDEIEVYVNDLLKRGIIKPSKSPFNFVMGLEEPASGRNARKRLVVSYSWLNERLNVEFIPIRTIDDVIDELCGQKYFSVFDLASASYQIKLKKEDRHKTAFTTRSGHYEFQRMPSTIKCASSYIQRLLNIVLKGMEGKARACYDDIIVYAPTIEEHEIRLRQVLSRIRDAGLSLQPTKCQLFSKSVQFLGYVITDKGWFPFPEKVQKLKTTPLPTNAKDLQSFLGLAVTIKRFIPNYTDLTQPMFDLLKQTDFYWSGKALASFSNFQSRLTPRLPLHYPNWNRKFHVMTSVSETGFHAVLKQKVLKNRTKMQPIAYAARKFKGNEINLDEDVQDVLANDWGRKEFSRYLRDEN